MREHVIWMGLVMLSSTTAYLPASSLVYLYI